MYCSCAAGAAPFSLILTSTTGEVLDLANIVTALKSTDFMSTTQFKGAPASQRARRLYERQGWPVAHNDSCCALALITAWHRGGTGSPQITFRPKFLTRASPC